MSSSGRSSYTPSFSLSSPSSSFPSSPSSVWRSSSSSRLWLQLQPSCFTFVHFIVSLILMPFLIIHFALACRSPQRSDVDNPMNNLHGRRGRTPTSGRGHQTLPLHHRTPSFSPPRRSHRYSNHRRHYSRSPRYSSDLSRSMSYSPHYSRRRASPYYTHRYRPYSYSRSPVIHRYVAYSPYDSREYSPDDSYHVRRYHRGRSSPSPLRARRRSRRSYSHSVSPRPGSYRRNYPRLSPEPKRRTVRESYSPSSSRRHRSSRSYRHSSGQRYSADTDWSYYLPKQAECTFQIRFKICYS